MTTTPYPVSGVIYDTDGTTELSGCVVGARNITSGVFLPAVSNYVTASNGQYTIDLANLTGGYDNGDVVEILVYNPTSKRYYIYETVISTSAGLEEKDITTKAFTYTSISKVSSLLGGLRIDMVSIPTLANVADSIVGVEDSINDTTQLSWKAVTVSNELRTPGPYIHGTGRPINLSRIMIKTFSSDDSDKIEVWDGSSWVDYLTDKTEGRESDYWVDYRLGIIYVKDLRISNMKIKARITYRYGESSVPGDINDAAAMMVAIEFLTGDDRSNKFPESEATNLTYREKITIWNESISKTLSKRAGVIGIGG